VGTGPYDGALQGVLVFFSLLFVFQGLFEDEEHGIEGACVLLLIHTNKLKTKAKKEEEICWQRQDETIQ
jgi:hypothetical protein